MDWLRVRLWQLVWWTEQKGLKRIFHWCLAFTVVWNFISLSVLPSLWNSAAFPTSWKALGGGIPALLQYLWSRLCLLVCRLDVWNVICDISSFPWLIAFSLWYEGSVLPWWSSRLERHAVSPSASVSTLSPRDAALPLPNLSAWVLQGGLTAIFVPPTSTSWEQEAGPIPAATGHWMVGEFGSSSPDWWMACLALSEQDGRCAGCGPQIVTFDCFISAWFIELSSPWNEVPRRFSRPHLRPVTHSSGDCGLSGRSENCVTKPGVDASTKPDLQHQKAAVKRRGVQMRLAVKPQRSSFLILALMNRWRAGGEAKWTGASRTLRCFT